MSSIKTFHLFRQLPTEIRCEIYLLATEPRFVEVERRPLETSDLKGIWQRQGNRETCIDPEESEEEEDSDDGIDTDFEYDEFDQNLRENLPTTITLHPSLAYFSHHWPARVRGATLPPRERWNFHMRNHKRLRQTPLTAFGFSCTTPPARAPWPLTARTPDVCRHWLSEPRNRQIAWELIGRQRTALHSRAPIPTLLHTCAESRAALRSNGYALCFGTRAGGPALTWFCPSRDVLYLRWQYERRCSPLLDGGDWGLGRLLPEDLLRVRRLALDTVSYPNSLECVSHTLRLLPKLQELFVVQQNLNFRPDHARPSPDIGDAADAKLWYWTECDEAEGFYLRHGSWDDMYSLPVAGCGSRGLVQYKKAHGGDSSGYFAQAEKNMEKHLRDLREMDVAFADVEPWPVPSVRIVHVGSKPMIKLLFQRRDMYWVAVERRARRRKLEKREAAWRARVQALKLLDQQAGVRPVDAGQLRSITPPPQSPSNYSSLDEDQLEVLRGWDLQEEAVWDDRFVPEDVVGGPPVG